MRAVEESEFRLILGSAQLNDNAIPDELLPEKEFMEEGRIVRRRNWNAIHEEDVSDLLFQRSTRTVFFFPVPNRILMMKRGLWHKINLVKNRAPMARCSISGFFRPDS
jgi:hypothetical protein